MNMKSNRNTLVFPTLLLLGLVWAVEIWLVQDRTFGFDYTADSGKELISSTWRFVLNLLATGSLVMLMPRAVVTVACIIWLATSIVLLGYHDIFDHALSWTTLTSQFFDGVQGAGFDIQYFTDPLVLLIAAVFPFKMYLLWKKRLPSNRRAGSRLAFGVFLCVAYVSMAYVGAAHVDRIAKLARYGSVDRLGATHGYLITWAGEHIYLNPDTLIEEALTIAETEDSSLVESMGHLSLPAVENIVLLQIESLDWRSLGHQFKGEYITPFLRDRLDDSIVFRTKAIHDNGSADADFIWSTGLLPSPRVVTYRLKDYPYHNTLADKASAAGYKSYFIHGNSGSFFERREAIASMRYTESWFLEELLDRGLPESIWGLDDDVLLDYLAEQLNQKQRMLAYVVTLSSHLPFHFVPEKKLLIRTDQDSFEERYYSSINYVDNAVSDFYEKLPDNTLLVMFGDHAAPVEFIPGDSRFQAKEGGIVPVFFHLKGSNLKSRFQCGQICTKSSSLAVVTWFHDFVEQL